MQKSNTNTKSKLQKRNISIARSIQQSSIFASLAFLSHLFFFSALQAQDLRPMPADANIVDVTKAPYNANGSDNIDDTEAIRKAISDSFQQIGNSRYDAPRFIYFPKGTYIISNTIESREISDEGMGWSQGWRSGLILIGESKKETILKLKDNAPGYQDPTKPKAVIRTGSENPIDNVGGGNQAFRHSIHSMTINTGSGNAGAMGIDYVSNNRGTIGNVDIKSGDGQGVRGISLLRSWPGPCLIKNVAIDGFDYGIQASHWQYSVTFEHIYLSNQKKAGVFNDLNSLFFRDLVSDNSVPVIITQGSHVVLIDCDFKGGASDKAAVVSDHTVFARNITSSGYSKIIDHKTAADVSGTHLEEYTSHKIASNFESPAKSLNLPIKETPEFHTDDFTQWANVETYGAKRNDGNDDSDAIQAAIDAGKPIVYLPNGHYHLSKPVIIRGNVQKIIGMNSSFHRTQDFSGTYLVQFQAKNTILEYLNFLGKIEHASTGTLSLKQVDHAGYVTSENNVGQLFLEDVIGRPYHINGPQKVWGRQVNTEFGSETFFVNKGGTVWISGWKTEGETVLLENIKGNFELLGALVYPLHDVPAGRPIFINDEGSVSLNYTLNGGKKYPVQVRERRDGVWKDFMNSQGFSQYTPLYTGYETILAPVLTAVDVSENELTQGAKLFLHPNPTESKIFINYYTTERTGNLQILDMTGRIVLEKNITSQSGKRSLELDVEHLNNGVYIVKIVSGEEQRLGRLIIEK